MGIGIKIEEEKDSNSRIILRVGGRLDTISAPILERKLDELEGRGFNRILLDFGNVEYLSSAGIRLMLSSSKKLNSKGGGLMFCSINDLVMEIIKMAGFEKILLIYPNESDALNYF